jgi:hypothetical protein
MTTRCVMCGRDAIVHDVAFAEPFSGEDTTAMCRRGWLCLDCEAVHWGWRVEDEVEQWDRLT